MHSVLEVGVTNTQRKGVRALNLAEARTHFAAVSRAYSVQFLSGSYSSETVSVWPLTSFLLTQRNLNQC